MYLYVGKIVNTHGIKGELRILSNFDKKDKVFKSGMTLYIGEEHIPEKIVTYRHHKEFEMVTFENYININEVLKYLKQKVYVKRSDLELKENEYVLDELVGLTVIDSGNSIGTIVEIVYNNINVLLKVEGNKNFYIPHNPNFIEKVDLDKKEIYVKNIEGLML